MSHLKNILFKTVSKRALWDCAIRCYLLFIVVSSIKHWHWFNYDWRSENKCFL